MTRVIPASAVAQTQEQIAEHQRLRRLVGELVEVSEGICEALLPGRDVRRGGRKKGGFKEAFAAEVVAEIEALVGPGAADGLDFEAIETAARRRALRWRLARSSSRLNADTSDHAGPSRACDCGEAARYAGRRPKTFTDGTGRDDA